ncbi:MAG: hypothetical protein O7D34_01805 [Ignavibacteria bacterium]|nr:hypothetical protein [Ignavibacteria bacterium]
MKSLGILAVAMLFAGPSDSLETRVAASVGRFSITEQDLLDSYEFGPAFVKRSSEPLRKHLEYMIYERLIAHEAVQLHFDTSMFVRERIAALEEDLAVDQLYKDEILSKVKLSEEEIEAGVQKGRMNLRLRWIYGESKKDAQRVAQELDRGVPFDSLFARQFKPAESHLERTLETTLLKLEHDNPEFAGQIANLRTGEVSDPLEGPDGFYTVRIDQIWQNPLLTESEYRILKSDAVSILRTNRAAELARQYVKHRMKAADPVIKAEGFSLLRAYLAEKGLSRNTRLKWDIPTTFMTEAGPRPVSASGEFPIRPLVTFGNQMLTVREYIQWFDIRQFQLRTSSLAAFNSSVKRTIWKLVQDKLLSQEAYSRHFNRSEKVERETRKWEAKLLYLAGRSHLLGSIEIPQGFLKTQYEEQKKRYVDDMGRQMSFEKARDQVWIDVYYDEERKVLFRAIQRLKKEVPVYVNESVLKTLSATVETEGAPINVIFYKPGGTFPRVAFPTIDESWQRFP